MTIGAAAARRYRGRFAPSPSGPLHQGSLVSALASYLDARAHEGTWLIRIEDIDTPRTAPGATEHILKALRRLGLHCDETPVWQSSRIALYQRALASLSAAGLIYPCGCTRREIVDSLLRTHARHTTLAYPGTCRSGLHGKPARAWRIRVPDDNDATISFDDRWQRAQRQHLATEVGDFVLKRADGLWAYQLAVVVDDAQQRITDVVRGADLLDSTARQIYLQRCLGYPTPTYLHVPPVVNEHGEKLSKQTGAPPIDIDRPVDALLAAASHLGLALAPQRCTTLEGFYREAVPAWAARFAKSA